MEQWPKKVRGKEVGEEGKQYLRPWPENRRRRGSARVAAREGQGEETAPPRLHHTPEKGPRRGRGEPGARRNRAVTGNLSSEMRCAWPHQATKTKSLG